MSVTVILVTGILLYANYNPSESQFFPKCPFYLVTGYQCPGCGFQRALHQLFSGNIAAAFRYNPLIFFLLPYLLTLIYLEYFANKTRPTTITFRRIFLHKWTMIAIAVLIMVFTIVRNII
jgi:hypothetical protein